MKDYVIMSLPAEEPQFLPFTAKIQFSFPATKSITEKAQIPPPLPFRNWKVHCIIMNLQLLFFFLPKSFNTSRVKGHHKDAKTVA